MKTIHAKSLKKSVCCRAKIYHFGRRRRQCSLCQKTWRIRKIKRGRKTKRVNEIFLKKFLEKRINSLRNYSQNNKFPLYQLRRKLRKSLAVFLKKISWPRIPRNTKLIAVADATMHKTEGKLVATYLIALKPLNKDRAIILKPFISFGWEKGSGWQAAFAQIPLSVKNRIIALVCDGKVHLKVIARNNHWLIQRCHFHLLGAFQRRMSNRGRYKEVGEILYQSAKVVLRERDQVKVQKALTDLEQTSQLVRSKAFRQMILEFIKNYQSFRTYLYYPELNLPTTTGSLESLNNLIKELLRRVKGFRTLKSLKKWISAFVKHKKFIGCRGSNFQPK